MKKAIVYFLSAAFLAVLCAFLGFGALEHPPPSQEADRSDSNGLETLVVQMDVSNALYAFQVAESAKPSAFRQNGGKTSLKLAGRRKNSLPTAALSFTPYNNCRRQATRRARDGLQGNPNTAERPPTYAKANNSPYFGLTLIRADC